MMLLNNILGLWPGIKEGTSDSARVSMDDVFQVLSAKPLDKNTSTKTKDDNT